MRQILQTFSGGKNTKILEGLGRGSHLEECRHHGTWMGSLYDAVSDKDKI